MALQRAGVGEPRHSPRVIIRSARPSLTRPSSAYHPPTGHANIWQSKRPQPKPEKPPPAEPPPPPPPIPQPLALSWTPAQLAQAVSTLGDEYGQVAIALHRHGISGAMLPLMDASRLPTLGIHDFRLLLGLSSWAKGLLVPPSEEELRAIAQAEQERIDEEERLRQMLKAAAAGGGGLFGNGGGEVEQRPQTAPAPAREHHFETRRPKRHSSLTCESAAASSAATAAAANRGVRWWRRRRDEEALGRCEFKGGALNQAYIREQEEQQQAQQASVSIRPQHVCRRIHEARPNVRR